MAPGGWGAELWVPRWFPCGPGTVVVRNEIIAGELSSRKHQTAEGRVGWQSCLGPLSRPEACLPHHTHPGGSTGPPPQTAEPSAALAGVGLC